MLFYLGLKTTWLAWLSRRPFSNKTEYQENHKTVGESHCVKQMEQWHLNWWRSLWNFNFFILENDNYHFKVETVKHRKCHFHCTILQFSKSILALVFQNSFAQNHFARDILTLLRQSTCQKCNLCIFSQKVQVQFHKRGIKNVVYGWGPVVLQRQAHTLLFLAL